MEMEELLDLLNIESPEEFSDFEHMADLIECDEEISYDAFYKVLSQVPSSVLVDITDNYFEDIQLGIPDDALDLFTLLDTVKQALIGLAQNIDESEDSESRVHFVDELFKFRNWYTVEGIVHCENIKDNREKDITVSEALTLARLEKLSQEEHSFDFSDCLAYDLDEYVLSFTTATNVTHNNLDDHFEEESDDNLDDRGDHDIDMYEEALIDLNNPVIDGEEYDDDYNEDDRYERDINFY